MGVHYKGGDPVDDDNSNTTDGMDSSVSSVSTFGELTNRKLNLTSTQLETGGSFFSTFLDTFNTALGLSSPSRHNGTNALFQAISTQNWDMVISICQQKPSMAAQWQNTVVRFFDRTNDSNGNPSNLNGVDDAPPPPPPSRSVLSRMLPLHYVCIFHPHPPTRGALLQLIKAYPNALVTSEGAYGRLPLHIACHSSASQMCIHELIVHNVEALYARDAVGRVPLHYALSNRTSMEVIEEFLLQAALYDDGQADEDSLGKLCCSADANGWLPLHVACSTWESAPKSSPGIVNQKLQTIRKLVDAYPDAVDCITTNNSTPLSLLEDNFHSKTSCRTRDELEAVLLVQSRKKQIREIRTDGYAMGRRIISSPARIRTDLNGCMNVSKTVKLVRGAGGSFRDIVNPTSTGSLKVDSNVKSSTSSSAEHGKESKTLDKKKKT